MKCRCLLLCGLLFFALNSCKKEGPAQTPTTGSLLLGKWQLSKSVSQLISSSNQLLDSTTSTSFTADDFVEYDNNGSGYYSESTSAGVSVSKFTYTLSGSVITEFYSAENKGVPESITGISASGLAIHAVVSVPDPNDPYVTDTEIDDYTYSR